MAIGAAPGLTVRPYSTAYPDLVKGGGELVTRVELLIDGAPVSSTEDGSLGLRLDAGTITADRGPTTANARQANLRFVETDDAPSTLVDDLSSISGNELRVSFGLGDADLFTQGVFGVSSRRRRPTGEGWAWQITGLDRSRRVSKAGFTTPYVAIAGDDLVDVLVGIYTSRIPFDVEVIVEGSTGATVEADTAYTVGADPAAAGRKLAAAAGSYVRFDADGRLRIGPITDDFDEIVWSYAGDAVTLEDLEQSDDDEELYNGVVVIGDGSFLLFPVRGEAWIDDPSDPLNRARIGERPKIIRNATVATDAQATAVAQAELNLLPGGSEVIVWDVAPNPAHELGDVFDAQLTSAGIDDRWVLDAYTLNMDTGAMRGTTRKRRSAS
ncbi:MAG: hypothetical protein AAGA99_22375 [Actinomycetota bacterium]